jgi:DNA-binding transcriptional LysR family regulator
MQDLNVRYLYEAARLGSMRAVADQLDVAVSSISRQISQLEAEVGVALIEHGRRTVMLTYECLRESLCGWHVPQSVVS